MKPAMTILGALGISVLALAGTVPMAPAHAQSGMWQPQHENRFERRGDDGYLNDQRGYSERRSGYRYYNGFWFPPAAFIAGAIIGGAIAEGGSSHEQWCRAHYRSYRTSDDSFQPSYGPRQTCVSPG